jgi:hypothetical protein
MGARSDALVHSWNRDVAHRLHGLCLREGRGRKLRPVRLEGFGNGDCMCCGVNDAFV